MMILDYFSGKIIAKSDKSTVTLVDGVSFSIDEGETLALIGQTGAGKTIIADSIMHLLPKNVKAFGIKTTFLGEDLQGANNVRKLLGKEIVYIPQSGKECLNPTRKIGKQIADALIGVRKKDIPRAVAEKLRLVGLDEKIANYYPSALSGGMAMKVVLAISACSTAKLVIADEPTNGVDENHKFEYMKLIRTVFPSCGVLLITHDADIAKTADEIIVVSDGKMLESGNAREIFESPLHPYTRAILSALPENGLVPHPKLRDGKSDCPFYNRCPLADENCLSDIPLKEKGNRRVRCAK